MLADSGPGFDSAQCVLARDPERLARLVEFLQQRLGDGAQVQAVLEIGSFAKGEAVPTSDIDTRVYVSAPGLIYLNLLHEPEPPASFTEFLGHVSPVRTEVLRWDTFNEPLSQQVTQALGLHLMLAIADVEYVGFLLERAAIYPSDEPAFLLQSNVLLDRASFVARQRAALSARTVPQLAEHYRGRLEWRLGRLADYARKHPADQAKLAESGQILWVAHAVRCLREAVSARTYVDTGHFVYRKPDVLEYLHARHPEHDGLAQQLYLWKTDAAARAEMVQAFAKEPERFYGQFMELTPAVAAACRSVLDG